MLQIKIPSFIQLLVILFLIQGCTPMNEITYLNDVQKNDWEVAKIPPKHQLEIGDILMVKVISRNEESESLFNLETNTTQARPTFNAASLYLNGFIISQDGTIDIPNVGEVFVLNKTLTEAETAISLKAKEFLINPFVIVKLANFQFTILGEVNAPGNYPVYKEVITIYDAIAMAGGINDYGNLQKVKIVRSENNKKQIYDLDLSSSKVLTSDFFYLRNNDLIYIKPIKFKSFKKSQSQLLLSALTTLAVLINVYLRYSDQ